MPESLGILGGMGPLATADFLRKLTEATPARSDQEHIPTIIYSVPQVPERTPAILGHGPSPLPAMREGVVFLENSGARAIAIACNTAHYWYDDLAEAVRIPILHIVDGVIAELSPSGVTSVGLMGTSGTLQTGIYQQRLDHHGYRSVIPSPEDMTDRVMPGIALIKAGNIVAARALLEPVAQRLLDGGADGVVMACTEIPVALADADVPLKPRLIDATTALARYCVAWWQKHQGDKPWGPSQTVGRASPPAP